jgi:hypothetical protein
VVVWYEASILDGTTIVESDFNLKNRDVNDIFLPIYLIYIVFNKICMNRVFFVNLIDIDMDKK